jgi:hypothetical protein
MELPLLSGAFVSEGEELFLLECLLVGPPVGSLEMRVMTGSAPVPIAAVKLEDEENAFILDVAIHPVAIFSDELRVRIKCVTDLDAIVVKEAL